MKKIYLHKPKLIIIKKPAAAIKSWVIVIERLQTTLPVTIALGLTNLSLKKRELRDYKKFLK